MFEQWLVHEAADVLVTYVERTSLAHPLEVRSTPVLEPDSPVVWFTFPGRWYDLGRFHLRNGTFTGLYANLLTPPEFSDRLTWKTTDLFLDIWLDRTGGFELLDAAQLEEACTTHIIEPALAQAARAEAENLQQLWRTGEWPPAIVHDWTLARVRQQFA